MISSHPLPPIPAQSVWATSNAKEAEAVFRATSEKPKPEWKEAFAWEMSCAHLFLLDLTKRMYLYPPFAIEQDDLLNYLGFAEVAIFQVVNHHHFEETIIFPYLVEHGAKDCGLDHNIEAHHSFSRRMEATWLYIRRVRALLPNASTYPSPVPEPEADIQSIDLVKEYGLDPTKPFDTAGLQAHLDTWVGELMHHLKTEIGTIGPDMTTKVGEENMKKLAPIIVKHLQQNDPSWFLCSSFATAPMHLCKTLLQIPMPVRRVLIPFWWAPKHWGMWLYCAHPENLTFAGTA